MRTMDEDDSENEMMDDEGIQDLLALLRILRMTKKWEVATRNMKAWICRVDSG